jgi:hypothetical protein
VTKDPSRLPCSRHYRESANPWSKHALQSASAIPRLKHEKWLLFSRVICESSISTRRPIAFRSDRFGSVACLNGARPKAKTPPLWAIVSRSIAALSRKKECNSNSHDAPTYFKNHAQNRVKTTTDFEKLPRRNNKTNQRRLFFRINCGLKTLPYLQYIQAQVLGSWQQEPKQTA